jgi:hypothetical protein
MILRKFLAPVAIAILLCGCSLMRGPRHEQQDYAGPLATITETGFQDSRTEVDFFVVKQVDGDDVGTSLDRTRRATEGMGLSVVPAYVEHAVPAGRTVTFTIMGRSFHAAPILSMLNSEYEVSGTVTFTPAVNRVYEVKGTLSKNYSAVWIEEAATGRIVGKKIEKRGN